MKKLATLAFLGTVVLGVADAQAFLGFGGNTCGECCPKPVATCDTCAPTMKMQRMEQVCTPCGVTCCPKLGFWYNY